MDSELMLSPHFALSEFTTSQEAVREGRSIVVTRDDLIFAALESLCTNILEPVREHFGRVHISSGYRPEWLNEKIGGAPGSQHCNGEAADIIVPGVPVYEVFSWIRNSALPFDQLIWEFDAWTHVSFTTAQTARHSVLTATKVDGKTIYVNGIA